MKTFKQFNEAKLSADQRRALPDKDFALPGKGEGPKGKQAGSYPIPDEKHARSALSLVSQHGTPEEKAKVRAKVAKKFPGIKQESVEQIDEVQITKLGDAQHKAMVDAILKKRELEAVKKKEKVKKEEVQIEEKAKYDNTKSPDYEKKKKALAKKHGGEENIKGHPQFEDKAFDTVVANLRKQHGKDSVITKDNPPKPPTEAQKKAYAAHKAKIAAQDTRDDLEKSSQGRYSRKYSNAGSD